MNRALLLIDRGSREPEAKEELVQLCKMIKEQSMKRQCMRKHSEGTVLSPTTASAVGMSPTSAASQGDIIKCKKIVFEKNIT